jgi:HEAT repeat protein
MSYMDPAEVERLTDLYCGRAAEEWASLRESGAEIALTDVYIVLQAAAEARREALDQSSDLVPLPERLERAGVIDGVVPKVKPPAPPMPLGAALRESRRLVMLGEAGSGKSTTLQYLGLCYARRNVQMSLNLNEEHVPVRVPLGGYAEKIVQSKDGLWDVLTEAVRDFLPPDDKDQAYEMPKAWNREGRLLVLLDGLDEVPEERRSAATREIRVLHGGLREMCRILLASRRAGYGPIGSPFKEFNLKPLEADETRLYLSRWLKVLRSEWDEDRADIEAGDLLEQMNGRPGLRQLTDNPQILKLAARYYAESDGKLAGNRAELYKQYVQSAYESREAPFSLDKLREVLEDLAWVLHTEQVLETPIEEIDQVRLSSGLIAQVGERWTFVHFTLQEYFVSARLAMAWEKNPEWTWRFIRPRLHLQEWHEPLLLLVGTLKKDASEALVRRVLKARSAEEELLARDLQMAAEIATENQGIPTLIIRQASRKRLGWHLWGKETKNEAVISAFTRLGKAALPQLQEAVKDPDPYVHWFAVQALVQMGEAALPELREALKNPDRDVRSAAARALGEMGEAALPELREALKNPDLDVRSAAAGALGQMGEAALPELREALKNSDRDVRSAAAWALGQMGEAALAELREALKDPDGYVRGSAAGAVGQMGEAALAELREALKDPVRYVRGSAAWAMGEMGEAALPALPELLEALKDSDRYVRSAAADALGQMGEAALPELREALKDPDRYVRASAVRAMGEMGEAALPQLLEALKDSDGYVRSSAAWALGQMGEAALPELQEALKDPDRDVRGFAAKAMVAVLAKTYSGGSLPEQENIGGTLNKLISILRGSDSEPLRSTLQLRERLGVREDPYIDPRQPPPLSRLERTTSFAGYFLSFIVLLGLAGILAVLSGSAGKVLGEQTTEAIRNLAADHPVWMLIIIVGFLAAAAGLLNFFLLDRIKERLKRR